MPWIYSFTVLVVSAPYYIKAAMGSRRIHPDSFVTRTMQHSRPNDCFDSRGSHNMAFTYLVYLSVEISHSALGLTVGCSPLCRTGPQAEPYQCKCLAVPAYFCKNFGNPASFKFAIL